MPHVSRSRARQVSLVALWLLVPGWMSSGSTQTSSQTTTGEAAPPDVVRASRILGAPVFNPQGEELGHVQDLAIQFDQGRIGYAVLAHGGVLWVGDSHVTVPWETLSIDASGRILLDATQDRLAELPQFDLGASWPETVAWPPGASDGTPERPDGAFALGVLRGQAMMGMPVRNHEGEELGQLRDLAIARADGQVVYVVVSHGGVLGVGEEYLAVPTARVEIDATQGAMLLGISPETLADAEPFQESWPDAVDWPFPEPEPDAR